MAIRFRPKARRPAPNSELVVNYYPVHLARTPLTDVNVGSVVRTLLETTAREMAVQYAQLQQVYDSAFVETSTGDSLDKVVALVDVRRLRRRPSGRPRALCPPSGLAGRDHHSDRHSRDGRQDRALSHDQRGHAAAVARERRGAGAGRDAAHRDARCARADGAGARHRRHRLGDQRGADLPRGRTTRRTPSCARAHAAPSTPPVVARWTRCASAWKAFRSSAPSRQRNSPTRWCRRPESCGSTSP